MASRDMASPNKITLIYWEVVLIMTMAFAFQAPNFCVDLILDFVSFF